jgi:peptidoglycan/xylan/chitin deacetylase (PgdA/CDA1 family)
MKKNRKILVITLIILVLIVFCIAVFTIFFDQAVLVRKGTVYHVRIAKKVVALTFDDGPSPIWTPQILDVLKKSNVKATFFMIGMHVKKYPQVAQRVAQEGHEIGNHSLSHHVLLYYTKEELKKEILANEAMIKDVTGQKTILFRPPKAWLTKREKKKIRDLGYKVVLWTLNSKDWVTFDDKYIIRYILKNIRPGDIILFHDSGGTFSIEGGDRHETVSAISRLAEKLKEKGYKFVTVSELLAMENNSD